MTQALLVSNFLLWLCVIGLLVVVLALVRQVGLLHERVAPAGALMTADGPKVGDPAPVFTVAALDGRTVAVGGTSEPDRSTLLFFLSPTCPVCKTLLPTLRRVARSEPSAPRIVLASDGPLDEQRAFVTAQGIDDLLYVVSPELGLGFQVGKLPYAVLIDRDGIIRAKGIVNTREHLESLFEAERHGVASIQELMRQMTPNDAPDEAPDESPATTTAKDGRAA